MKILQFMYTYQDNYILYIVEGMFRIWLLHKEFNDAVWLLVNTTIIFSSTEI